MNVNVVMKVKEGGLCLCGGMRVRDDAEKEEFK